MKNKQKLFALTLLMCGTIASAWADGVDTNYIINEDFSGMGSYPSSYNGWSLWGGTKSSLEHVYLKIEDYGSANNHSGGYTITPELGYNGNVILKFSYGTNKNVTSNIYINTGNRGTFADNSSEMPFSITNSAQTNVKTTSIKIYNVLTNTKIKFVQKKETKTSNYVSFYIGDVKIIKLGDLTLNETIDSSEPIEANDGTEGCVVHTIRTLTGGIWNTLCLPFDVDMDLLGNVLGANQNIQLRTYTGYANKVMTFEPATSVAAGTPFLIKLNTKVENPVFTGVKIKNTHAQSVTHNGVSFVGTYRPVDLQTDGSELFITKSSNMLSVPAAASNRMYGMRAFIQVSGGVFPARIVVGDDETADLSTATVAAEQDKTIYDLNGQQVMHPKRGLYIVNNKITFLK